MNQERRFYTYAYLRSDGTPYYIGKGTGYRIFAPHHNCSVRRPRNKCRIIFLKTGLTEEEAYRHEEYMINILGRKDLGTGMLRNLSNGGHGGKAPSPSTREKLRAARLSMQCPRTGKKHTEETIEEYRKARKKYDYVFISPDGEVIDGQCVAEFCADHPELSRSNLLAVASGKRSHHKGWKVLRRTCE